MRASSSLSLLILGLLAATAPVQAADIIEQPVYEPEPIPAVASGWYLRGDVGYNFESKTRGHYAFWNYGHDGTQNEDGSYNFGSGTVDRGIDELVHYDEMKLRDGASVGVGAGFRFSDQFRADVTLDRFKTDVDGTSDCAYLVEVGYKISPVIGGCKYQDKTEATVWTAMANAYVDLAHFGPVTPYVGAGIGMAHVSYDDMNRQILCGTQPGCAHVEPYKGVHPGEDSWRLATSLMAGATIDLTQQLKLDAGYRYTRIEDGDAYGYDGPDTKYGATGVQGKDEGFDVHAVRAGLRYEFY